MSSTPTSTALALAPEQLATYQLSVKLGVDRDMMLTTVKAQCFPGMHPDAVTTPQLLALIQVAHALSLNPLLPGMLYAFKGQNGGIVPMIGPDGMFTLLSNHADIQGWVSKHEKIDGEQACTVIIKHKRLGEVTKTCFLSEWRVGQNPNWTTRPRHMLEIRTLKQCARQVIHGIPMDEDERVIAGLTNVTGTGDAPTTLTAVAAADAGNVEVVGGAGAQAGAAGSATPPAEGEQAAAGATGAKRVVVPRKPRGGVAATGQDAAAAALKNVTPAATPPAAGNSATEDAAPAAPGVEQQAVIDVETTPVAAPAVETPAAPEKTVAKPAAVTPADPEAAEGKPAPASAKKDKVSAQPAKHVPRYEQQEGWPKVIEASVESVKIITAKTVTLRDGTVAESCAINLITLRAGKGSEALGTNRVLFDPENVALNKTAKTSMVEMSLTVELWPSQNKPGEFVAVVTKHEDPVI